MTLTEERCSSSFSSFTSAKRLRPRNCYQNSNRTSLCNCNLSTRAQPARLAAWTFFYSSAPSAQGASNAPRCSRFRHPLSLTLPLSSEGPILAPRALSPKWTSPYLPSALWLTVYIGLLSRTAKSSHAKENPVTLSMMC